MRSLQCNIVTQLMRGAGLQHPKPDMLTKQARTLPMQSSRTPTVSPLVHMTLMKEITTCPHDVLYTRMTLVTQMDH